MSDSEEGVQYQLSWEMPNPFEVSDYFGGVYPRDLSSYDVEWQSWHEVTKTADTLEELRDQHDTLTRWAETGVQAIRNVRLSKRRFTDWETVEG